MSIFTQQNKHKAFSFIKVLNIDHIKTPQTKTSIDQQSTSQSEKNYMPPLLNPPVLKIQYPKQKGCNCKKSLCLKMYCQCFSKGEMCNDTCLCQGCKNKSDNTKRSQVINNLITKDPFIFSRKDYKYQYLEGDACNCKKSKCQKKYCDCFRMNRKCTKYCNCIECQNYSQGQIKFQEYKTGRKKVKFQ